MRYDLIIVGDAMAARVFLYELNRRVMKFNTQIPKVLILSDPRTYEACSLNSTASASRVGLQRDVGALGDKLLDAFELFEIFLAANSSANFYCRAQHYQLLFGDRARHELRYGPSKKLIAPLEGWEASVGESYLLNPHLYLSYLHSTYSHILNCDFLQSSALRVVSNGEVITSSGKFFGDRVVLCAGAAGEELLEETFSKQTSFKRGSSVSGSYLEWIVDNPMPALGESWQFSISKFNVIYRALDRTLLLGGTNSKNVNCFHPLDMKEQYGLAKSVFKDCLPEFTKASFKSGERSKLPGRRSFWGRLDGNVYAIRGLYKNGVTLSHLAAHDLLSDESFTQSLGIHPQ